MTIKHCELQVDHNEALNIKKKHIEIGKKNNVISLFIQTNRISRVYCTPYIYCIYLKHIYIYVYGTQGSLTDRSQTLGFEPANPLAGFCPPKPRDCPLQSYIHQLPQKKTIQTEIPASTDTADLFRGI